MALSEGQHLILDLYGVDSDLLWNKRLLTKFLNELPSKIGMKVIRKAEVIEYRPYDNIISRVFKPVNHIDDGLTGFVILAESHCSFHSFPNRNFIYIDIFSCKSFDSNEAAMYITELFDPEDAPHAVLKRGTGFDMLTEAQ